MPKLMNPRTYRLRADQHSWLTQQARKDESGASRILRQLIDQAMKRAGALKKFTQNTTRGFES